MTIISTGTAMAEPMHAPKSGGASAAARVRLTTFLSPAFPVGAFSYSHGLEWAIESGRREEQRRAGALDR